MRFKLARVSPAAALPLALALAAGAQSTTRVSVDSNGVQGNDASLSASISADGRYVAFSSRATNLVPNDTNGFDDIFLRDRASGTTTLMSVNTTGGPGNASSFGPEVDADGRAVDFFSSATDLVSGDTNASFDAFARTMYTGATTIRVSVNGYAPTIEGNRDSTRCLRALGYFDGFESRATNLVATDANGFQDVFVHSWLSGTNVLASVATDGTQGNGDSSLCAMSAYSSAFAFRSIATNLVAGDTNGVEDIFVRDAFAHTTTRVSISTNGAEANGPSTEASLDRNPRLVAFSSRASNLVPNDTNGAPDIFVRDLVTGVTTRVSVASNGAQANGPSSHPAIAAYVACVAFYSEASNLVPGDNNGRGDVFVRDLAAGTTTRVSTDSNGFEGNGDSGSTTVRITWDGRTVLFDSLATNLVPGDTNGFRDIFVHDRGAQPGTYCSAGTSSHGCVASISGNGTPSASSGSGFAIDVFWVEGQKFGIVFYGTSGPIASPWAAASTSWLCVKSPLQRTESQSSNGTTNTCFGTLTLDWNAYIAAHPTALGAPYVAGQHVYAQAWYRDPPAPKTTNLSDALEFVVQP